MKNFAIVMSILVGCTNDDVSSVEQGNCTSPPVVSSEGRPVRGKTQCQQDYQWMTDATLNAVNTEGVSLLGADARLSQGTQICIFHNASPSSLAYVRCSAAWFWNNSSWTVDCTTWSDGYQTCY